MRKLLIAVLLLLSTIGHTNAQQSEIFAPEGKAIKGYDPVAFFKEAKAVKGTDKFSYTWKGVQWGFSSQEHLEDFRTAPEQYAPQYGGYCAYGTAQGHKAPTETGTWTIINNKLYFNYNGKVKEVWMKKHEELIGEADKRWKEIKDKE